MKKSLMEYEAISLRQNFRVKYNDDAGRYVFDVEVFKRIGKKEEERAVALRRCKWHKDDCRQKITPRSKEVKIREYITGFFKQK